MSDWSDEDDWEDDPLAYDDPDEVDDDYPDESEELTTDVCPRCGEQIYDDTEHCPYCEHYLSKEDTVSGKPWWMVAGVAACLLAILWWAFRG